jgi:predicted dehydrogenase
VVLKFKNGGIGHVSTPWITRVKYDITGVATEKLTIVNNNGEIRLKADNEVEQRLTYSENDMWVRMNQHFIDCIRFDRQPLISLSDGLKVIAVSEAAYSSLQERREVFVE